MPVADFSRGAILRKRVTRLIYVVASFLFLFDLFIVPGLQPGGEPYYAFLFAGLGIGYLLHKRGYDVISACITLFVLNAVVFAFSLTFPELLILYVPIAISSLVLFPIGSAALRWGFLILSYVLLTTSHFADFTFLLQPRIGPSERMIVFFVCATASVVSLAMIAHFYISISHESEKNFRENHQALLKLTDNLQKSQARFELVIKGSRAGIYEWNVVDNSLYLSPEWKNILGLGDDDLTGFTIENLADLMHPDDREELHQKIQEHFETRQPYQNESRRRHKNGGYRWIFDSGLSITNEHGDIVRIVGSIIDITNRKNAELQVLDQNELLKRTNEELDRFVYSASHDLRSPLGSMLGLVHLAESTTNLEEIRVYHNMIRDRIKRLDTFITEVLEYSRNSRQEIVTGSVSVDLLIEEIIQVYREDKTPIVITHRSESTTINTDPGRLKIVLNNLIGNAIKYYDALKPEPFVSIKSHVANGFCNIGIEDNGIGIEPQHQAKVFDMFYRASQQSEGSGLGLFITKEIVEKLGGRIQLTSTPGKGTQIDVSIPVV